MNRIYKCHPSDLFNLISELNSYRQAKANGSNVNNVDRLISLLKGYYEALLYYSENSPEKYIVTVDGVKRRLTIGVRDANGNPEEIALPELADLLARKILSDISSAMTIENLGRYMELIQTILSTPELSAQQKMTLLHAESLAFDIPVPQLLLKTPERIALDNIAARKEFNMYLMTGAAKQWVTPELFNQGLEEAHKVYELSILTQIRILISNSRFIDILKSLMAEAEFVKKAESGYINKPRLIWYVLKQMALNNNLFHLDSQDRVEKYFQEFDGILDDEQLTRLHEILYFNPENIDLADGCIEMTSPDFRNIDESTIKTIISFVIPMKMDKAYTATETIDAK